MGAVASRIRANSATQTAESRSSNPYGYPPVDGGNYFSAHYHLGHKKFQSAEPEVFLFGELSDINFLGSKPAAFPYKQPTKSQPIKCLRSFINLQRDSIKLVKSSRSGDLYHLEFTFDADVDCRFTIYNFLPDSVDLETLRNDPYSGEGATVSRPYRYPRGSEQQFTEEAYTVAPVEMEEEQMTYDPENRQTTFPIAVLMETARNEDNRYQSQLTLCALDKFGENGFTIKVLKQKLWVDGMEYLLQEIYGIENKSKNHDGEGEGEEEGDEGEEEQDSDEEEDLGAECVICITDPRDTILLPCRHLCLCSSCAGNLRFQSSNCPICRAPFRALLQIQALEPLDPGEVIDEDEATGDPKYSIPGFRCVSLLQALNGYQLEDSTGPVAGPIVDRIQNREGKVDDDEEEQEEEEGVEERSRLQNHQSQITTTQFCVIPIEDEEEILSSRTPLPPTSSVHKPTPNNRYEIDEDSIPLPGTPSDSDEGSIRFKLCSSGASSCLNPLNTTVTVHLAGEGGLQPSRSHDSIHSDSGSISPRSSSVGSDHSVKSTDMLLPGGEKKTAQTDSKKHKV